MTSFHQITEHVQIPVRDGTNPAEKADRFPFGAEFFCITQSRLHFTQLLNKYKNLWQDGANPAE